MKKRKKLKLSINLDSVRVNEVRTPELLRRSNSPYRTNIDNIKHRISTVTLNNKNNNLYNNYHRV
tara:strand:+ start:441 stop:635 length:195 start_codon:yes stop_codon:yes gene_type:complete